MKRKFNILVLILLCLFLVGCQTQEQPKKDFIITIEYNNGDGNNELVFKQDSVLTINETLKYEGYRFLGWFMDKDCTIPLTEPYIVTRNITLYAKWEALEYTVNFYVDDELYETKTISYNDKIEEPAVPVKEGYTFKYWGANKEDNTRFNFYKKVTQNYDIYAKWEANPFTIKYNLGYDAFATKNDLYESFFTDFYNFMLEETDVDMTKFKIENLDQFLDYCSNWNAGGKSDLYGAGDAFAKYFLAIEVDGKLENQPATHFIGYCYQNNKYEDFIPFLMKFFAYWRTDEGYTGGASDPNNTGNDFFASAWASLVDTCKFFYFTSKTLNDKYPWFNSERVKDALDNVPSVIGNLPYEGTTDEPIILPILVRDGYIFLGWFDESGKQISMVNSDITVYAKWKTNYGE